MASFPFYPPLTFPASWKIFTLTVNNDFRLPPTLPVIQFSPHLEVEWFAEDIERLPEADVGLARLELETFEALPL
jgi:hypothetical protein